MNDDGVKEQPVDSSVAVIEVCQVSYEPSTGKVHLNRAEGVPIPLVHKLLKEIVDDLDTSKLTMRVTAAVLAALTDSVQRDKQASSFVKSLKLH